MNTFGQLIRTIREQNNLSRKELAARLLIDKSTFRRWENDQRMPNDTMSTLTIAHALEADELMEQLMVSMRPIFGDNDRVVSSVKVEAIAEKVDAIIQDENTKVSKVIERPKNELGVFLMNARKAVGLTRAEVATALDVKPTLIRMWEDGVTTPTDRHTNLALSRAYFANEKTIALIRPVKKAEGKECPAHIREAVASIEVKPVAIPETSVTPIPQYLLDNYCHLTDQQSAILMRHFKKLLND